MGACHLLLRGTERCISGVELGGFANLSWTKETKLRDKFCFNPRASGKDCGVGCCLNMVDPLFTEWSLLVTTTVYQLFDTLNKCLHQVSNLWGSICWRKYSDFCKEIGFGKYFIAICHV